MQDGILKGKTGLLCLIQIFSLILNSSAIFPSEYCTLSGKILDSLTCRPLKQVTVKLSGTQLGAISDSNGNYIVKNIPIGSYDIIVSMVGYRTLVNKNLSLSLHRIFLNFKLQEAPTFISDVMVRPKQSDDDRTEFIGSLRLDHDKLKRITGNFEDVFRSVSILPGVAQINNYHNDLVVQGGGPSENLFVIDGTEVSNINHFGNQTNSGGVLSFINIDYVKSLSFLSGGFSSLYGDKISSATEISMQSGNTERLSGKAVISATQFAMNIDGPVNDNTSFILSARRSYLDMLFRLYGFNFAPEYYDFFAKLNSRIDTKNDLSFLFIGVLDKVKFFNVKTNEIYENPRALGSNQNHFIAGLRYKNVFEKGFFNINLSRDFFYYKSVPNLIFTDISNETVNNFKLDFVIKFNPESELDFGVQTKLINFNSNFRLNTFSTTFNELLEIDNKETNNNYLKSGAYIQFSRTLGTMLKLDLGLRTDFFDGTTEAYTISPRVAAKFFISDKTSMTLYLGSFRQTPEYLWIEADPVNKNLKSITSRQMHLEIENMINNDIRLRAGGFIKKYSEYPVSILRPYLIMSNVGTGFSGVDDNFAGSGLDPMVSQGEGSARGLELYIQKNHFQSPLWGTLSLTYSKSEFKGLDKIIRPGSFDQRWNFVINAGYLFNENWEISTKFSFATGTPYTPFTDQGTQDPKNYNAARIENIHSLDFRIDKKWNLSYWRIRTYLDVQNVYNHKVRTLFIWDKKENKIAEEPILGIVPSFGISIEF